MGERALKDLKLPRQSFALLVIHRGPPAEVQYSCVADGLQASTGASVGKLNLKLEEAPADRLKTTVQDRKSGRVLTFTLKPDLARSIKDLPYDRLEKEGERVAGLPDEAIFDVVETKPEDPARPADAVRSWPAPATIGPSLEFNLDILGDSCSCRILPELHPTGSVENLGRSRERRTG